MFKILITDKLSQQGLARLEEATDVVFDIVTGLSLDDLLERIPPYDALIIRSSVRITEEVLARAGSLKVIGRAGVGIDNVDLNAASLRGVMVMNTPDANTIATVEHTIAMLLALCRHLPQAHQALKSGGWDRHAFAGTQLYRKTLGVIGLGRVGSRVAIRCQAFGMKVLAYDPYIGDDVARELKIKLVDLDELLAQSDFISLHTALTPDTEGLINAAQIARMKDGVRLVNCARGALINEADLVEALRSGKMAGAALDVFAEEPLLPDSPLRELDNVILTPHLAASTVEAQRDVSTKIVDQVLDALRGVDFRNTINMPVIDPKVFRELQPYLQLVEKVGSLQTQLAEGRIARVEVEFKGEAISDHVKPLTVALLKGLLDPVLEERVNYINAPHLARRRGITVSQTRGLNTPDYPNLISCRALWEDGQRVIAATLFHRNEPRIVQIDQYRMDARPAGHLLVVSSRDIPGVIGKLGTILGSHGINIAAWRYGRTAPGGDALSLLGIDSEATPDVIAELEAFEPVYEVKRVKL